MPLIMVIVNVKKYIKVMENVIKDVTILKINEMEVIALY